MPTYIMNEYGAFPDRISRVAEILQDYNPYLELRFIPVDKRTAFDSKPFAVWHCPPDGPEYMIMAVKEDRVDHRLLADIFKQDNSRQDVLAHIEADERAAEIYRLKEEMDAREAAMEFTEWAVRQDRRVKHNGVTYE